MVRAGVRAAVEELERRFRRERRPLALGAQERKRHLVGRIVIREERGEFRLREERAENRVNDGVEHEVLNLGRAREKRGVAEDHMVKLVHHEHEQMLVRLAMSLNEVLVEQELRRLPARHAGGLRLLRKADAEEREKRRQLKRARWNHIENPCDDLLLVGHGSSPFGTDGKNLAGNA